MEKLKTRNEYVGCNRKCRFYADEIKATSYDHWNFVKVINGKVVFNHYNYSSTTSRHQWAIRSLLRSLGIKIDLEVNMSRSLTECSFQVQALESFYNDAVKHLVKINTKRTTKKKKAELRQEIVELKEVIAMLRDNGAKYSFSKLYRTYRYHKKQRDEKLGAIDFMKKYKGKTFLMEKSNWDKSKERLTLFKRDNDNMLVFRGNNGGKTYRRLDTIKDLKPCPLSSALEG